MQSFFSLVRFYFTENAVFYAALFINGCTRDELLGPGKAYSYI